jgi:hypothetical protein
MLTGTGSGRGFFCAPWDEPAMLFKNFTGQIAPGDFISRGVFRVFDRGKGF